ncbi:phosphatase PAP2 family protein [Xanthobacteraceae bacterium Astr-EGSB]|uniref:phosphatase PAP2 family protein n=1 Tax=Astrobacterium formosum TaxID=3069710 RepID=UPI0027B640AC|nr:phosphatase PAP2 family protein [Xanthobacteraceae bacterium Astr-EGSB]
MSAQGRWWVAFVVAVAATALCYVAFDRPVSYFAHDQLRQPIFVHMQRIPEFFVPIAVLIVMVGVVMVLTGRTLVRWQLVALTFSASLAVTSGTKDFLKLVFGRTWPETWTENNPSLIRDGVSGFNFFHGGSGYASFPSGHTAAICAAMTVLWMCYPRFRPIYALLVTATVVGLVGANYHFLSDVVFGGFLGASVALAAVRLTGLASASPSSRAGEADKAIRGPRTRPRTASPLRSSK